MASRPLCSKGKQQLALCALGLRSSGEWRFKILVFSIQMVTKATGSYTGGLNLGGKLDGRRPWGLEKSLGEFKGPVRKCAGRSRGMSTVCGRQR